MNNVSHLPNGNRQVTSEQLLAAVDQLTRLTQAHQLQVSHSENGVGNGNGLELQQFEKSMSPGFKLLKVVRWTFGFLVASSAAVFASGQWWSANAMKTDLDIRVVPIEKRVKDIEFDMRPIKSGVATLVSDRNNLHNVRLLKRKKATHDKEFETAVKNWKKEGRRRGARPRMNQTHLQLFDDLKIAEEKI